MKLSKFLRKNSRTLILVFMSLLLIAFLIPDTIQRLSGPDPMEKIVLGRAFGRAITVADQRRAAAELQVLAQVGMLQRVPEEAALDYYLLLEEAQQRGILVSPEEVRRHLAERGTPEERLKAAQRMSHLSYDRIYSIIGRWMAVSRLFQVQVAAVTDSLPRQEIQYRNQTQEAVVKLALVDDRAFRYRVPEPTAEELAAFFEECKDRVTTHTEQELVYGYRLPNRVRLEYLTVNPDKVRDVITVQAVQVKRYFQDNQHRYMKPDPVATQPVNGRLPEVPMTFEEARDQAREDYRTARAIEVAQSLVNDMYAEAHRPWGAGTRGDDGFLAPPEGGGPSFEELRKQFSATYEVEYGRTDLVSVEDLRRVPGLGQAGLLMGRQYLELSELAFRVKGILEKDPGDGQPVFNVLEPAPVVLTVEMDRRTQQRTPHQAYLFRVVEVAPAAPPASLEEVRAQLVQDWKLVKAHQLAKEHAEALAARAREVGLETAVEEAAELKEILAAAEQASSQPADPEGAPPAPERYVDQFKPFTPPQFTRARAYIYRVGTAPGLTRAVFDLAATPASDTAPAHRVTAVPVANVHKWAVAELVEIKPIYQGPFEEQLAQSLRMAEYGVVQRFYQDWLSPRSVQDRVGFRPEALLQPTGP